MKLLTKLFTILLLITVLSGGNQVQVYANTPTSVISMSEETIAWPQSDIIEWRYKTENGKLYKRQYNYTKVKWIGNWQLVS